MAISSITTDFIRNKGINFVSELANNNDSIMPMLVKDTLSNTAIVHTYSKEGGKDDAREKFIEEFGTGAAWLLLIPFIKEFIFDKLIYPKFNLNPEFNIKQIKSKDEILKNITSPALDSEKQIFATLDDKNETVKKIFKKFNLNEKNIPTNAKMYKSMLTVKFAVATTASAFALVKIIKLKQKTTQERIEKDFQKKNSTSKILVEKDLNKNDIYQNFTNKNISFTGLDAFMTNPILNTALLDCVIATTRLKEARQGERKEVLLKEIFQAAFTYCLAKPIQKILELIGNKTETPIELDPRVLFDKNLKEKIQNSMETITELKQKDGNIVENLYKVDPKNALVDILEKNNILKTVEKNGEKAISFLKPIDEKELSKSLVYIENLSKNINNLSKIKAYKLFSVFGNVFLAIAAMGVVQPKLVIKMRKLLNNGDNRNPAIVEKERQMYNQKDKV